MQIGEFERVRRIAEPIPAPAIEAPVPSRRKETVPEPELVPV